MGGGGGVCLVPRGIESFLRLISMSSDQWLLKLYGNGCPSVIPMAVEEKICCIVYLIGLHTFSSQAIGRIFWSKAIVKKPLVEYYCQKSHWSNILVKKAIGRICSLVFCFFLFCLAGAGTITTAREARPSHEKVQVSNRSRPRPRLRPMLSLSLRLRLRLRLRIRPRPRG